MKTHKILLIMLVTMLAFTACTEDKKKGTVADDPSQVDIHTISEFPSINEQHGCIGEGTSMNVLEFVGDDNDTLYVDMNSQAIKGGEKIGDEVQLVYTTTDSTCQALVAINITALQHLWTQIGDDGNEQSLELNSGGRATTYDMAIEYDSWSVANGTLLLHSPKQIGDERPAVVDTFEIMELTSDKLVLSHGQLTTEFVREN